ncbi:MAG: GNAT family N-acetyltransferase [Pseudomonadota bacterium]
MFKTSRLSLNAWEEADFEAIARILQDAATMHHWPAPLNDDATVSWLKRAVEHQAEYGFSRWRCELKTGEIIGDVGALHHIVRDKPVVDLGYIIHADYWGRGYGLEAAQGSMEWLKRNGKALNIQTIVATMATDNIASVRTAQRLDMQLTDTFHNRNNLNKESYYFELRLD